MAKSEVVAGRRNHSSRRPLIEYGCVVICIDWELVQWDEKDLEGRPLENE